MPEGSFRGLEESKCQPYVQEVQEGGSMDLQVGQPHLNPWDGDGATNPENHFQTGEGQKDDQD